MRSWTSFFSLAFLLCTGMAINAHAQFTTLVTFNVTNGATPSAPLIQGTDGNLYGTTSNGGTCEGVHTAVGCGTVFKMTPDGTVTVLYSFCAQTNCTDGSDPQAPLVQATDGNFYGTTSSGGAYQAGTVFKITPEGVLTTLYSFCAQANCPDGQAPLAGLVQATDGNLYGTTRSGGAVLSSMCTQGGSVGTCGTIFKITLSGTLTTLYNFCSQTNCVDGDSPMAGLIQATDGNFYGTTTSGGTTSPNCQNSPAGCGTIFKITPEGGLTTLYSFCTETKCADGELPLAGLIQATDGNFYGTASGGGSASYGQGGTVFRITPDGTLTTLYSFCTQPNCTDGKDPAGVLFQGNDGDFYGTTSAGGAATYPCFSYNGENSYSCGTVFRVTPTGALVTLYSFCNNNDCSDGMVPAAGLLQASDGKFYGTTAGNIAHGPNVYGTLFSLAVSLPAIVSFSPTSLTFPQQLVGTTSQQQVVTLTNAGGAVLTVSNIGFTGANPGDFAQTNNCPSSVAINGTCQVSVTFTPTAGGSRIASLSVTDNAEGSPQTVSLLGTAAAPVVGLSPSSFAFPDQYVGTSGLPQTLTVTNTGNAVLTITSVASSLADFGTLSNCTNPVQPGANCTIGVFFDPSASGVRSGNLLITDNATGSPQIVTLTGTGEDFSLSASSSSSATVMPGQTATYTVSIAPGGGFNQAVALSCSGAPAQSTCTLSQNSVTLNGSKPASVTVTVTTAGASASLAHPAGMPSGGGTLALWLGICGLPAVVLIGRSNVSRKANARLLRQLVLLCGLSLAITWSACGGGNSSGNGGNGRTGTPAGTYNLTLTGSFTSGSTTLTRKAQLTLVVQ